MDLPGLDLAQWEPARLHWQLVCQMMGKVRLALHPPLNHWWHVPLYVSARGLTTADVPYQGDVFDIEHDVREHALVLRRGTERRTVDLPGRSIAETYEGLHAAMDDLDIRARVWARPYECASDVPFRNDSERRAYDPAAVENGWTSLAYVDGLFKQFRGRFIGKCSPVHMFWHSFDLAVTRFSGRLAPPMPEANKVTQEAYSHEVISAGFWFGDPTLPEAAYYCYGAPSPAGIVSAPLSAGAEWVEIRGAPMAILRHATALRAPDPSQAVLDFLESSYEAYRDHSGWSPELVRA